MTIDPFGYRTTTVYDAAGQPYVAINPRGYRTTTTFDSAGQPTEVENALAGVTTTVYDAIGNTTALVDPQGNRNTFIYDAASREVEQVDPLNRVMTSAYDAAGRQTLRIDPRGYRTTYSFDANDNLTGRAYPDLTRTTFSYDVLNQQTIMEDATGCYTTVYDAISRKTSVTDPASKTITYAYDAEGNRATMTDPDSGLFTYSYDPDNLLITLVNPQNDRTTYSYDEQNRRVGILRGNLTRTSFSYDANSQIVNVVHRKSDNSIIDSFGYSYDAAGNRSSVIEADNSLTTYSYDATNQLTSTQRTGTTAYAATFTYDASGNRIKNENDGVLTRYEYDAANQLTVQIDASGRTTFTFDAAGNQQVVLEPSMSRTTTTWNYENQPTNYETPVGALVTMTYNPDNRRVSKETVSYKNNFIWDVESDNVLLETDDFNVTQVVYTNDPVEFGSLISQRRSSATNWYHFDALGSTRDLTNGSETITDSYLFDAWGNHLTISGSTTNPMQYVGEYGYYFDPEMNSNYVRARVYQPTIARWWSIDSLGFVDGLNLYKYVKNNSTNIVDPSGLQPRGAKAVNCKVRVCLNPIGGAAGLIGGHLYIVLERTIKRAKIEWAYRGGPGGMTEKRGKGCDCTKTKYGQLVGDDGEYKPGFVDYVKPNKENCKSFLVQAPNCEKVHECFVNTLKLIDECCITYTPVPLKLGFDKKCNSNCVVGWTLKNCIKPRFFIGGIPLPIGKLAPGVQVPRPRCIRNPEPKKKQPANNQSCSTCPGDDAVPV